MKGTWNKPVLVVMMGVVVAFMAAVAGQNLGRLKAPARDFLQGRLHFSQFVSQVQENYTQSLKGRRDFISLNGWFAGLLDQTVCNNVVKLENGMMTEVGSAVDTAVYGENAGELKDFLAQRGAQFLYVQAPSKIDLNKTLLPEGIEDFSNENASALLSGMQSRGVRTLDLRQTLSATAELSQRYFFKTDLHWNMEGAFLAFQEIAGTLKALFPEKDLDISYADADKWQRHEKKNLFMGGHGQRVGPYFSGIDDAVYFTPAFDTDMSCAVMNQARLYKGDFEKAIVRSYAFEEQKNYFDSCFYSIYVGDNAFLTRHRNPNAPNDLRILMLRDSFGRPVGAFLSTLFQEVDVIDPRNYRASLGDYVDFFQPDVVIELLYTQSIGASGQSYFSYDIAQAQETARSTVFGPTDVEVLPESRYAAVPVTLEEGSYILRFDDVEFASAELDGAAVQLFSANAGESCDAAAFDVEYCRTHGGFSQLLVVPKSSGGDMELRFLAGDVIMPSDQAVVYKGVVLEAVR